MGLMDDGIILSVMGKLPEEKYIVLSGVSWKEAVEMAIQCRRTHPEEPIELIPNGDLWNVVRRINGR